MLVCTMTLPSINTISRPDLSTIPGDRSFMMSAETDGMLTNEALPAVLGKVKFVACRKCHARKVKCPGGQPCKTCVQLDCQSECIYPIRDRQVRVSESYINSILHQNQSLRAHVQSIQNRENAKEANSHLPPREKSPPQHIEPRQNPLLSDTPWFVHLTSFNVPLRVGEGADTAFATRFRQAISQTAVNHPPRLHYPNEAQIAVLSELHLQLNSTQARFLVQAALANIDKSYHIVRESLVWALLDRFLGESKSLDLLARCKIFSLLALGELYTSRCKALDDNMPGLAYFSLAFKAYGHLLERPCLDSIEVTLLLSIYSLCINRWHSAYFLASSAIRHCAVMGLHFNIPEAHLKDNATREHSRRLWWTSYILEHTCAVNSGQMILIHDDEILVDFPCDVDLSDAQKSDFSRASCMCATIQLVRLSRKIMSSLYGTGRHGEPFLTQVQSGLRDLKQWFEVLPQDLKLDSQGGNYQLEHVKSLHLLFNQCLILTTRPLLLYMVRLHQRASLGDTPIPSSQTPDAILALVQACIRSSRKSYTILAESWISGSFKTFDYTRTQYLFSSATILVISSFLGGLDRSRDQDNFDMACKFMQDMVQSGSIVAAEFDQHLKAIKTDIYDYVSEDSTSENRIIEQGVDAEDAPAQSSTTFPQPCTLTEAVAADLVLSEPSLDAFLLQNNLNAEDQRYLDSSQMEELYWPVFDIS